MINHITSAPSPEQRLFIGVIVNAVFEGIGRGKGSADEIRRAEREARRWFAHGGEDFDAVCSYAGLHPDDVRSGALAYFAAHDRGEINVRRASEITPSNRRHRYGVSQYDIANHAGVSQQTVSRVLAGGSNPNTPKARRVRAALAALTANDKRARAA